MEAITAIFTFLIIGFLVSSGSVAFISYNMVQEVNRKRGRGQAPLRWSRDLIGIIADYRGACPKGRLLGPLVVAILFALMTGAGLFAASSRLG